jgi:hypothetical protein
MGTHNRSEYGRDAWVALYAHPTYTFTQVRDLCFKQHKTKNKSFYVLIFSVLKGHEATTVFPLSNNVWIGGLKKS